MTSPSNEQTLKAEIARLECQLSLTRAHLHNATTSSLRPPPLTPSHLPLHHLLLLSDSALPLGSFAFSSGLESYLAHHPGSHKAQPSTLPNFLSCSLHSLASTTLPYLIAAYTDPSQLQSLDQELDACTLCPVAKRASIAQGRALLTLWERALRSSCNGSTSPSRKALAEFSAAMKSKSTAITSLSACVSLADEDGDDEGEEEEEALQAHFPLIYGTVSAAMGMTLHEAAYTYLFNHVKAVVSAGVRASVTGPYAAQGLLGSEWLRAKIEEALKREWGRAVEEAGQSAIMVDLWVGRHELLYSRIFNS